MNKKQNLIIADGSAKKSKAVKKYAASAAAVIAAGVLTVFGTGAMNVSSDEESTVWTAAANVDDVKVSYINITVSADGKDQVIKLEEGSTAADALEEAEIELDKYDILTPKADEIISDGDVVDVARVEYVREKKLYAYKYDTEYVKDDTLYEGESEVKVHGVNGRVLIETLTKVVDGKAGEPEVVSREITMEAVNEVILTGTLKKEEPAVDFVDPYYAYMAVSDTSAAAKSTKGQDPNSISMLEVPEWLELDENGVPVSYTAVHTGRSCAYTAKPGALMSTGKAVFQGYVAVDPNLIPYGSELYIIADDGSVYGYAIAADTGSTVRKGKIVVDLFMNEYDDCIQWGNRSVTVYVLK